MKKQIRRFLTLCSMTALTLTLAACGSGQNTNSKASAKTLAQTENTVAENDTSSDNQTQAEDTALSGQIAMAGSTSMEKLANALAEDFMEKNGDVTVTAEFTGSSAGIESLLAGSVDIGNASRNLKDSETAGGAVENIVAIDGIAVVVNPENSLTALTKDQLISIYKGEVTNWSELGGSDEPIVVVGREAGSGTRGAFEEILGIEDACAYALELDSTGTVVAKAASTAGAIGYVSLDMVDDTVTAVELDGTEATAENIKAGSYFLSRPFVMATAGEISDQSALIQSFFEYIYSDAGTELVESVGLIAVD